MTPFLAASAPDIRVCIMNDDFSSEAHKNLRLTSDAAWQLTFHNKVIQYPADEVVELNADDFRRMAKQLKLFLKIITA